MTIDNIATIENQQELIAAVNGMLETIDDRVAGLLVAGSNVTLAYDDVAGTLTIAASGAGGGGIADAPSDGVYYVRRNLGWTNGDAVFATDTELTAGLAGKADQSSLDATNAAVVNKADTTAMTTADALRVLKAGDSMSGDLTIDKADPALVLKKAAINGQANTIFGQTVVTGTPRNRWGLILGSTTNEAGSNAGSNFGLARYNDAGALIDNCFFITRSDGQMNSLDHSIAKVNPSIMLSKTASGQGNTIAGRTNAVERWQLRLGDAVAEGGSNAGSHFSIVRYADAGVGSPLGTPFQIKRNTGAVTLENNLFVGNNHELTDILTGSVSAQGPLISTHWAANVKFNAAGTSWTFVNAGYGGVIAHDYGSAGSWTWFSSASTGAAGATATLPMVARMDRLGGLLVQAGSKPGGGDWTDSSDARIKTELGDYAPGLAEITALRPVRYRFKGNDTSEPPTNNPAVLQATKEAPTVPYANSSHYQAAVDGREFVGLIAQEVEAVLPGMVTQRSAFIDGQAVSDLRDLDTTSLIFALVNAVKTLAARVEALESPE